jgi:hypothetical protein
LTCGYCDVEATVIGTISDVCWKAAGKAEALAGTTFTLYLPLGVIGFPAGFVVPDIAGGVKLPPHDISPIEKVAINITTSQSPRRLRKRCNDLLIPNNANPGRERLHMIKDPSPVFRRYPEVDGPVVVIVTAIGVDPV